MLFYFAWIDEAESFDPQVHARQDEDIFNLRIAEQEGLFPTATVTVVNATPINLTNLFSIFITK